MASHVVEPVAGNVHGRFSRELPPILRVASGERIRLRTLDSEWGSEAGPLERPPGHDGHALCGPILVEGAVPGDELEVRIEEIRVGTYGFTWAGGWDSPLNRRLQVVDGEFGLRWRLDADAGVATSEHGERVPLAPFPGVVGVALAEPGLHSTTPPRRVGGNLDCAELVAGSRLFLPVEVEGALLSLGDGHAAQGDGEVSGLAIECPFERIDITVVVHRGSGEPLPRAETPAGTVTFGFGATVDEAAGDALEAMVELLRVRHGLERRRALALASVAVDLRITQLVNTVVGSHAVLRASTGLG